MVPNGAFSGVAKDGSMRGIGKAERPNFVFLSERPDFSAPGGKTFHIRYTGSLERLIPAVRAAVREVDGRVPVFSVRTMDEEFLEFTAPIRIVTTSDRDFCGYRTASFVSWPVCRDCLPYCEEEARIWNPVGPRGHAMAGSTSSTEAGNGL